MKSGWPCERPFLCRPFQVLEEEAAILPFRPLLCSPRYLCPVTAVSTQERTLVAEKCICCEPFRETSLSWHSLPSTRETEQGTGRKAGAPCPGEDFPSMAQLQLPVCGSLA